MPSLFSKQMAESTVQTDLIGPVDFKVLTETGRTEYLTDEGMLGSEHAFLDEVFDGRDMLLRSILNVLHERELKHGRRVTTGRIECVVMTSNRYLSEVLARSPELLLAFADRLSFICFVPKSFARRESRAAMLQRFSHFARPDLRAQLSLQQVDLLQDAVTKVVVPSHVMEGVELLADALERALAAQVAKLPDYVPTKYFSQRSVVKALWALKAAVVRDQIYRRPERALEATVEDLDSLRWFFLLGGPPAGRRRRCSSPWWTLGSGRSSKSSAWSSAPSTKRWPRYSGSWGRRGARGAGARVLRRGEFRRVREPQLAARRCLHHGAGLVGEAGARAAPCAEPDTAGGGGAGPGGGAGAAAGAWHGGAR